MPDPNPQNPGDAGAAAQQPQTIDAVATALGVELSDETRAAHQAEKAQSDQKEPEAAPAAAPAPPADAPAPPDAKPEAQGAASGQAGAGGKPDGTTEPKVPTPEEIAALLDGKPQDQKPGDQKTGQALLDEPIPDEVKGRTRERMQKLLDLGRETHVKLVEHEQRIAELQPLADQAQGWERIVVGSGLPPEDFATVMGTMAAINNGTPEQKRQALARIDKFRNDLATQLGETVGGDPLAGHDDLRQMVADLEITAERAAELATLRNRSRAQTELEQRHQQATAQQRDFAQAQAAAEDRLNAMEVQLKQRDGDAAYAVRRHVAMRTLRSVVGTLHPNQWAQAFLDAYSAVPQTMVDSTLSQLRGDTGRQQQRTQVIMQPGGAGGAGGGGGNGGVPKATPKTTQDAVFAALGLGAPG